MAAIAFAALALSLAFWILHPLLREEEYLARGTLAAELKDLLLLRDVAYDTLRDLEFDFRMGKMAESDYLDLKIRYQSEAAEILRQIQILEERLEAEAKAISARRRPGRALS